ncbi:MAG TPA: type II toxin-antitoxin system RelB/DinJ family antitoxin [Candidatus Baltobacteraceae bacterium]|jgi:antitoxin component of RelBE/YafQ-DinJ toxin-antitoxin module|nr:type II toxin-antitoxin system RelB/DinJ family antitoxin [Candidatus Baltobacteraceae bacterium]
MTVLFRCRVEKPLLAKANAVTKSLGTSTAEMFRIFVAEIARTGKVPVDLNLSQSEGLVDVPRRNKIWSQLDDAQSW